MVLSNAGITPFFCDCLGEFTKRARVATNYFELSCCLSHPQAATSVFLNEFSRYLDELNTADGRLLIVGDFNFIMDDCENSSSVAFHKVLDIFSLKQFVTFPTHSKGYMLDLILTQDLDRTFECARAGVQFSGHIIILCDIVVSNKPPVIKRYHIYESLSFYVTL